MFVLGSSLAYYWEVRTLGVKHRIRISHADLNAGKFDDVCHTHRDYVDVITDYVPRGIPHQLLKDDHDDITESAGPDWYHRYHPWIELRDRAQWLSQVTNCRFIPSIGKTVEGRDIWALECGCQSVTCPAIYLQAGIHAREFISSASVMGALEHIMTTDAVALTNHLTLLVVPLLNVDGYDYAWTKDRMWRKNRRVNQKSKCFGVDLNRNFDAHFGMTTDGASSPNPCSETHNGHRAFSEPETTAVRDYITGTAQRIVAAIDFHSYSQLILSPYGWCHFSTTCDPPNEQRLWQVGETMKNVMQANYTNEHSSELYLTSGSTDDWLYAGAHIPLAYTIELPDRGQYGFKLPPRYIVPTIHDVFESIRVLATLGDKPKNPY